MINRINVGVYEMGSTFKALTIAMALDSGKVNLNSRFDARGALTFGRFKIHDYHAQNRALTVPEVFTYSSNVGIARMALGQGVEKHKAFLRKMGQLTRMRTELPESAEPIVPKNWGELNTMTIAFGHGLAVAPLQAMMAVARVDERRLSHHADLPQAQRGRSEEGRADRRQAGDERSDALSDAPQRREGHGQESRHRRLFRRRQDRHGGEGDPRPLFQEPPVHDLHGGGALG